MADVSQTTEADLLDRLAAAHCTAGCNSAKVRLCALCEDAKAEIERLRAALGGAIRTLRNVGLHCTADNLEEELKR